MRASLGGGTGTRLPASTEDCRDVGGSSVGCGTGTRSGTAKSCAADWPGKPSFTPVVLALSLTASVEGGTAREPVPLPRDTASASLLRAVRDRCWNFNLSIETTRIVNRVKASWAIQHNKHAFWLRWPLCIRNGPATNLGLAMKAWQWGLGIVMLQLAKRLNPFYSPAHRTLWRDGGDTPRRPPVDALRIFQMQARWRLCNGNTRSNPVSKC